MIKDAWREKFRGRTRLLGDCFELFHIGVMDTISIILSIGYYWMLSIRLIQ